MTAENIARLNCMGTTVLRVVGLERLERSGAEEEA